MNNPQSCDLSDPAVRRSILKSVPPNRESATESRGTLLAIFEKEMEYRQQDEDDEYFENLYWCAFLLYLAGNPADVPLMWKAKHVNMDTAIGLDGHNLVGAGIEATIRYLETKGEQKIVDYIRGMKERGELDRLRDWEQWRVGYFYAEP